MFHVFGVDIFNFYLVTRYWICNLSTSSLLFRGVILMFLDALMALRLLFFVDLSISVLLIPIERSGKFFNIRNPIEA